jgi:hypothetical protein
MPFSKLDGCSRSTCPASEVLSRLRQVVFLHVWPLSCQVYDATEEAAQILFKQAAAAGERYLAHR